MYYWVCCCCKTISFHKSTVQCINVDCQHAFSKSHCTIEGEQVRVET